MALMALDHVRDYFHLSAGDPLDLETTTPFLFFTRWITHYCAPTFVFLSGLSVYLQSRRKSLPELSSFLVKRGLWLILLEISLVSFGWTFNPAYPMLMLQVIWAIGISMVLLGLVIRLPFQVVLALGLLIVLGHNLLDIPESAKAFESNLAWDMLHYSSFRPHWYLPGHGVLFLYPFLPWAGLMMLGYCAGRLFQPGTDPVKRRGRLALLGTGLILFFVLLRWSNVYGDPVPWTPQRTPFYSFLSFIKVYKYPPSLLYMCMTIGPALLLLALLEGLQNRFTDMLKVYGRVPLFYYVLHIYLIHILCMLLFFAKGHTMAEAYNPDSPFAFYFLIHGEGFSLAGTYGVWLLVLVLLYPICRWYDRYKTAHKEKWWLSYL